MHLNLIADGNRSRGLPAAADWAAWAGDGGSGKSSGLKRGRVMTPSCNAGRSESRKQTQCVVLYRDHPIKSTFPKKSQPHCAQKLVMREHWNRGCFGQTTPPFNTTRCSLTAGMDRRLSRVVMGGRDPALTEEPTWKAARPCMELSTTASSRFEVSRAKSSEI